MKHAHIVGTNTTRKGGLGAPVTVRGGTRPPLMPNMQAEAMLQHERRLFVRAQRNIPLVMGIFFLLLAFLWSSAHEGVQFINRVQALGIGIVTLMPWYFWFKAGMRTIPFVELISLYFFMIFCPSVFLEPVTFVGSTQMSTTEGDDLTKVLNIVLGGLVAVNAGYAVAKNMFKRTLKPFRLNRQKAIKFALIYLFLAVFGQAINGFLPRSLSKVGDLLFTVNGSVATYLLTYYRYMGYLRGNQAYTYWAGLALLLMMSLATGWLGVLTYPMLSFVLAQVHATRKIPWGKIAVGFVALIAFNVTKAEFREQNWHNPMGGARVTTIAQGYERTSQWFNLVVDMVEQDFSLAESTKTTLTTRVSNIGFFSHIILTTPEYFPHMGVDIYENVPAMFVPRLVWKDKPTTMDTANEIAVRYGYLTAERLGTVALDVGLMPEAYIAYGTRGVVLIMFGFGLFWGLLSQKMGGVRSGLGWNLVLLGIICGGGLMITWTASSYLGSFYQTAIIVFVMYWPLRARGGEDGGSIHVRG